MTQCELIEKLDSLQAQRQAYRHALGVLYTDAVTFAPEGSDKGRGETIAFLTQKDYELFVSPETLAVLEEGKKMELDPLHAREIELLTREYEEMNKIPMEEYVAYQKLLTRADVVWHKAKRDNDFASFRPCLEEIVATLRRFASYFDASRPAYDVWLNQYERGLTMERLDAFFANLRGHIVPLLKRVQEKGQQPSMDFLRKSYPIELQRKLSDALMAELTVNREHCSIAETEHPFTNEMNKYDVRITTKYLENMPESSLFSVVHESGHALYELGVDDAYWNTCVTGGVSMSIHESQSRFFENNIGRSRAFCCRIWPRMQELFPQQTKGATEEDFYRCVNRAEASLIRTEADELTYCLHIMVRYELEKALFSGTLEVKDLPRAWQEKMQEYLGIDVPNDTRGVLQDSHWSGGLIGYFPSYALGSAYAAQFYAVMNRDFDVQAAIADGHMDKVVSWLQERVHRYGKFYDPDQLFQQACGEKFDAKYYVDYLTRKYTELYDL